MLKRCVLVGLLIAAAATGCGGDDGGGDDDQPDAGSWTGEDLAGACALDEKVGEFVVEVGLANYVQGAMQDAVSPNTVLEEVQKDGSCVLLKRDPPVCSPACQVGTQVCGLDDMCHPAPRNQDLGTVTVSGLTRPVSMQPDSQNGYFDTDFSAAPFAPGALIQLDAAGGATVPAFTLRGIGVVPLELAKLEWVLVPGQPFAVEWTASGRTDLRVHLRMNVDQHGNTPIALECDVPDTGSFTIPATMIDALLAAGISGVPNAKIERHSLDSKTVGPGCVELVVRSQVGEPRLKLRIEGVDTCPAPAHMCPPGKTCNTMTEICE
jgi:hypothetical protein